MKDKKSILVMPFRSGMTYAAIEKLTPEDRYAEAILKLVEKQVQAACDRFKDKVLAEAERMAKLKEEKRNGQ